MPKHGYKPVMEESENGELVIPELENETPAQAISREFFQHQGGYGGYAKSLNDDFNEARGVDAKTGKKKREPKVQAVQVYHGIIRGWSADAHKDAQKDSDGLPYDSEEERAQLIEMLLEEVLDSRELRRKFVGVLVKRDPELIDELYSKRQLVIEVTADAVQ